MPGAEKVTAIRHRRPSRRESALAGSLAASAPPHHALPTRNADRKARQTLVDSTQEGAPRFPSQAISLVDTPYSKRETPLPIRLRNKPHYGACEPVPHVGEGVALILPHQLPSHTMQCASLLHQRHCVDLLDLIIREQHLESRYSSIITRAKLTILIGIVSSKSR